MPTISYASDPTLSWNNIRVTIPHGYFIQYLNENSITIYPKKNDSNVHIAIEFNDISKKSSVISSKGKKENNCTVTYMNDLVFNGRDAFEWKTYCPSIGTRKCITIPDQDCEICYYGDEDKFHEIEQLMNNISFINR